MGGGVIDENYRDNIGVILFKFDDSDFVISIGDRISQLVVERISTLVIMERAIVDVTARHNNAFGSTGFQYNFRTLQFVIFIFFGLVSRINSVDYYFNNSLPLILYIWQYKI